jgi:phosphodiesterase/alkaline phosphatase D-like protein
MRTLSNNAAAASTNARAIDRRAGRLFGGVFGLTCVLVLMMGVGVAWAGVPETPLGKAATGVSATGATLHGELNPGAQEETVEYQFRYRAGASCAEGTLVPVTPGSVTGKHKEVSEVVSGLEPSMLYTYCLDAINGEGEAVSGPVSFTTLGHVPAVDSETVSGSPTPFDAVLEGQVNPENQATTYRFQYATNAGMTGAVNVGEGSLPGVFGDQAVGPVDLGGGLTPGRTYYYRVVAVNAKGSENGAVKEFQTATLQAPVIETETVPALTTTSATLAAVINPEFQETTCKAFQYVPEETFKASGYSEAVEVPCEPTELGAGGEGAATGAVVTGLTANTAYEYRVLAENATGETQGREENPFLTPPILPQVTTQAAGSLTARTATLMGTVNPANMGQPTQDTTTYFFQYGSTTAYGLQTSTVTLGEGTTPTPVTASIEGLAPGTTYHYRLVAANEEEHQVTYGADETLITTGASPSISTPTIAALTASAATVSAALNPEGLSTRYELAIGETPGALNTEATGQTTSPTVLALAVGNLAPSTTYYYKIVAANPNATIATAEQAFTTLPAPPASSPISQPETPPLLATPPVAFPIQEPEAKPKPKLTNKQLLEKGLKTCRRKYKANKHKRTTCEQQAHHRYPTKK